MTARRSRHCWLRTCSSNSFAFLLCDKYVCLANCNFASQRACHNVTSPRRMLFISKALVILAKHSLEERYFLLVSAQDYRAHFADLKLFDFALDEPLEMYRTKDTPGARRFLEDKSIAFESLSEAGFDKIDPDRQEQLQAVKRWFYNDWRRIEPKLRTSIVEGISVFLSLFDDNPA